MLNVLPHSFPTRRSSDLSLGQVRGIPGLELAARDLLDDLEADAAIGVLERQVLLAEALTLFRDGHTALDEMFLPPGKCADGRVIRNRRDLPGTALAGVAGLTDGKGGVQRARFAELIAEIQMINGTCAVVEHGLLDEPLSQRLDEKDRKSTRLN